LSSTIHTKCLNYHVYFIFNHNNVKYDLENSVYNIVNEKNKKKYSEKKLKNFLNGKFIIKKNRMDILDKNSISSAPRHIFLH